MSEFWDWAVVVYAKPDVAEACLDLQDTYGQNVPLLLWAIWCGGDVTAAVATARSWEDEVVGPLRGVRRRLKGRAGAVALRERVKAAELDAERRLMAELESLAGEVAEPDALAHAAAAWGVAPPLDILDHLRAIITAA